MAPHRGPPRCRRPETVPDGGVHRTQNAQFRMTLLPGFKLEWLCGGKKDWAEQVGCPAGRGLGQP